MQEIDAFLQDWTTLQSPMEYDILCSDENSDAGSRCDSGSSSMETITMVRSPTGNAGRVAMPTTQTINQNAPGDSASKPPTSRMKCSS